MMYCPKYSVGSKVVLQSGESGEVISIDASLKSNDSDKYIYKIVYLVNIGDSIRKVHERHIKDSKIIDPKVVSKMDVFLADSLLLTRHSNPDATDKAIKELLNLDSGGK